MTKLPSDISQMIDRLCQNGDRFAQIDQLDDALDQYEAAWELLPEPKIDWPAATWILMAIGDVSFEKHDYVAAANALEQSLGLPDGQTNPFIKLRFGQSLLEIGDLNRAANFLEIAFREGGEELFAGEDPKYLHFVKTQLAVMNIRSTQTSGRFTKRLHESSE